MASPDGRKRLKVDSREFARTLTRQSVAHVCSALGFTYTTSGVMDCLVDLVEQYLWDIAKHTSGNAGRAGRTEPNIADALQGLQQMQLPVHWRDLNEFAFGEDNPAPSGSELNKASGAAAGAAAQGGGSGAGSILSANAKEVRRWDQPFHHSVPAFPMPRRSFTNSEGAASNGRPASARGGNGSATIGDRDDEGPGERPPHIPAWMPPPPPGVRWRRHRGPESGARINQAEVRSERVKRQRQSEAALRNLGKSVAILSPPAKKTTQGAARVGGSDRGSGVRLSVSANRSLGEKKQHPEASESRTIRLSLNTNGSPSPHGGISGHNSGSSNSIARGSSHSGSGASRTSMAESGGLTRPTTIHLGLGNRNADNNGAIGQPGGNARLGGGGGGQEFRKSGFRTIVPGALGTNAWPKGAAADGKASPSSESGGKARSGRSGAFGKLSDASREDRILEGLPPDGTGDVEGTS